MRIIENAEYLRVLFSGCPQGQRSQRVKELAGAGGGGGGLESPGAGATAEKLRREAAVEAEDGSGWNSTGSSPDNSTLKNRAAERERERVRGLALQRRTQEEENTRVALLLLRFLFLLRLSSPLLPPTPSPLSSRLLPPPPPPRAPHWPRRSCWMLSWTSTRGRVLVRTPLT